MPLLCVFWVLVLIVIFRNILWRYITHAVPSTKVGDFEIDEDLDNYFNTLDEHDRNWSIKEELNCREVMNMKILDDSTLTRL
jgi:hypothetical protein